MFRKRNIAYGSGSADSYFIVPNPDPTWPFLWPLEKYVDKWEVNHLMFLPVLLIIHIEYGTGNEFFLVSSSL